MSTEAVKKLRDLKDQWDKLLKFDDDVVLFQGIRNQIDEILDELEAPV